MTPDALPLDTPTVRPLVTWVDELPDKTYVLHAFCLDTETSLAIAGPWTDELEAGWRRAVIVTHTQECAACSAWAASLPGGRVRARVRPPMPGTEVAS